MQVRQHAWTPESGWEIPLEPLDGAQLLLAFGDEAALRSPAWHAAVRRYPDALVAGCTTAGEIMGLRVRDASLSITAVRFDATPLQMAAIDLGPGEDSRAAGARLVGRLAKDGLAHVLVFSDGHVVNGSALVQGMMAGLPVGVQVTGGLAGDGARFQHTFTLAGPQPREGRIVAIGLYGSHIRVGVGSLGGWDPFGPQRTVTRSEGNVLYELDGQPALALYKRYLGEHVQGLPATGLLFPLALEANGRPLVRTILGVDEGQQSMVFAGDIPQGATARLMKANFDRLVDGAQGAARATLEPLSSSPGPKGAAAGPQLALLISCVGRKLVLRQRVEEEVEAVRDVLGPGTALAGFYSYGEICPAAPGANCELHNQTMTITTLREA